jgi:hypothetical protein
MEIKSSNSKADSMFDLAQMKLQLNIIKFD